MGLFGIVPDFVDVRRIAGHVVEHVVSPDVGPFAALDASAQVNTRLDELEDREVEVGAQAVTLVGAVRPRIAILHIVKALLVEVVQHHVVAGNLRTAVEGDISVDGIACIAQRLVVPVDVGSRSVPVGFQLFVAVGRGPTAHVVADRLVVE